MSLWDGTIAALSLFAGLMALAFGFATYRNLRYGPACRACGHRAVRSLDRCPHWFESHEAFYGEKPFE